MYIKLGYMSVLVNYTTRVINIEKRSIDYLNVRIINFK